MRALKVDRDIKPLSEFRSHTAACLQQVHETGRPIVITQHGRGAAVVINVQEYERLLERVELLQDIVTAETEIKEGKGIDHETAKRRLLERLGS